MHEGDRIDPASVRAILDEAADRIYGAADRGAREVLHPAWGEERGVARFVLKLGRVLHVGEYADVRAWMEGRI